MGREQMLFELIIRRLDSIEKKCDRLIDDVSELKDKSDEQQRVIANGGRY
ncbi:hypothetical protein M3196_11875 [Fictibacillus nanhaiensis]|nr:hypothetical protein [Fictibacillus nanhaiensis]MCM3732360.1 hypothetical protein [Fictibacillus nanhaiensis]